MVRVEFYSVLPWAVLMALTSLRFESFLGLVQEVGDVNSCSGLCISASTPSC